MKISYQEEVAKILLDIESIKFSFNNPFILTSGEKSPVYVDCRKIISFTKERNKILDIAEDYIKKNKLSFNILAGGETAGIPYASFLAERLQKPMVYIRKKSKGFGKNKQIEGSFKKKDKAILIEDLSTDGASKEIFVNAMKNEGLIVKDIFVIFYYNIFKLSKTSLSKLDVKIHYLCTWKDVLNVIKDNNIITKANQINLNDFIYDPINWRKKNG
ncbi:MAG: orotate phosphoribosyltransferase [Pelagibacteraceae bacterium]|nr:orotate phosphoribosyltransferase [Pelagibacteraceae bacterium]PPR47298.1 MAG: Orotate phosphoribosyltransferase [Alphaproteobacteria bacterium MarineAlpha5_Bin9]|tara:strand:+ start:3587 stop:4234 length:648 start_codon:yes stop_codon:yes gene_type:complete